jgi:excisionase family DNA binding protein
MKTYLGVSKIAKITGKPRTTILRWIQSGQFGEVKRIGNEYQITHEQFLIWWKRNMNSNN